MEQKSQSKQFDNWDCANALERFKQRLIDPLKVRVSQGHDYIINNTYEKECKTNGITPDPKRIEKTKNAHDTNVGLLREYDLLYEAVTILIKRHEHIADEIAGIYIGIKENIIYKDEFPKQLMSEEQLLMQGYWESIIKLVEGLKIEG